jgi:hypothetical protein
VRLYVRVFAAGRRALRVVATVAAFLLSAAPLTAAVNANNSMYVATPQPALTAARVVT